ncbi:uncharacterized protein LOC134854660 [Symsagittifera roscoffensis]|uniref:uncharacterized protein LOC134854660 n=1 Tax=Symsagittifera roscoffensis TaxID=84072 RepID=UPI00307BCCD5
MADRFWKSMPAALKRPTLDELYRRLRDLDYTQVDERMAVLLNAILQLEEQGECRESATEAVVMVGYTTEGISNQEQTRWLSWNVDGGVRGFDLARNPGLSNNTEYGAGEFPLPTRPSARSASQSTSKPPSITRAQQTEKTYPDLSNLKRAQRENNKANLERESAKLERNQANLERDQAILERDQARRDLDMLRAEYQQEQRVRENAANCEQLKSELERIQRRQRELDRQKEEETRTMSRMEVDEAHRSKGRFNLDRAAQKHINEGLEVWIPTESASSLRCLETQPIRSLMDVVGAVHLIVGDSLVRVLTRIQSHWQTGVLSFSGAAMPQMLASLEMLGMARMYTVTLMLGTNDVSRGESRKVMRLHDKVSCILEELRIQMDPAILTVCTTPYNMKADQHAIEMNEKVRNLNEIIRQIHQRSVLPVRLLDVADQMERSFPEDASSDGIHFDRPRGVEWLNDVFQRHISELEADLLETAQFTFGPPPNPPFLATRPLSSRLGARVDSRDSSRSSWTRLPGSTPMGAEEAESSTPQSSVVSSVVVVDNKRVERPAEASRARYLEKVKELDLEDLECRQELAEVLGLKHMSHEDLSRRNQHDNPNNEASGASSLPRRVDEESPVNSTIEMSDCNSQNHVSHV